MTRLLITALLVVLLISTDSAQIKHPDPDPILRDVPVLFRIKIAGCEITEIRYFSAVNSYKDISLAHERWAWNQWLSHSQWRFLESDELSAENGD